MGLEIKIKKIMIHPEDFEIEAIIRESGQGISKTLDTTYYLKFNPSTNWSPYELVRKIGVRMSNREGQERKVFGTVIRDELLKITEQDFQRRVYYLWNASKYKQRIGKRGIFKLFHKDRDGAEETRINFRMAFGQALFQKEGGKKSDKSWYWLGNYRDTQIDFFSDYEYKYIQQSLIAQFSPEHYHIVGLSFARLAESANNEEYLTRACRYFEMAVKYKKDFAQAYSDWAGALFLLARIHGSEKLYLESLKRSSLAIKQNKQLPLAYYNRGAALYELADLKARPKLYHYAIESFNQTVRLMKNFSGAYCYWALILQKMAGLSGDLRLLEKAREKYLLATECDIVDNRAYMNLANVLSSLAAGTGVEKYFREAIQYYQLAEQYDETNPIVHSNWASCLLQYYNAFKEINLLEESIKHIFQAFLLSILRKEWDLAIHFGMTFLSHPSKQFAADKFIQTQVFLEAIKKIQFGDELTENAKSMLTNFKGQDRPSDIVINAVINKNLPHKIEIGIIRDHVVEAATLLGRELLTKKGD